MAGGLEVGAGVWLQGAVSLAMALIIKQDMDIPCYMHDIVLEQARLASHARSRSPSPPLALGQLPLRI